MKKFSDFVELNAAVNEDAKELSRNEIMTAVYYVANNFFPSMQKKNIISLYILDPSPDLVYLRFIFSAFENGYKHNEIKKVIDSHNELRLANKSKKKNIADYGSFNELLKEVR